MTEIKDAVIQLITQPLKRQERADKLINKIFHIRTKSEYGEEIQSFFKLAGPHINKLSHETIEVIMSHLYSLEINADPTPPTEETTNDITDSGFSLADRDVKWNEEIALSLIKKLRECYAILGFPERDISPGELSQQSQAIANYSRVEELELKKNLLRSSPTDLQTKLLEESKRDE